MLYSGMFLSKKYLTKIFGKVSFEHVFGIVYMYSTFLSSNITNFCKYDKKLQDRYQIPKIILIEYIVLEFILIFPVIFLIFIGIILISITYTEKLLKKISTIKIEYTEEKIIEVEKLV